MKRYQIAIYLRISSEDDKEGGESGSITMQRIYLQNFVAENFTDYDRLEFCDDGYTGTNFERPGVQNLLKMVRDSQIDCIVVKDFSRFARDYIELGSYLEQIFPFLGVRFISVNDNYDSANYQGSIADIDVNFKNLLYDLYSKDISQKIRSSFAVKKEQGQYISAHCPFGYEKDPKDRHKLLIAEDEAEVVRRIFALAVDGYSSYDIAKLFNETQVKTPIEFKIEKGETSRRPKGDRFLWRDSFISLVLKNEIYIGNIIQKKTTRKTVNGKNYFNPREDWLITYGHHEPIIDKEMFEEVQCGERIKKNHPYNPTHPLIGKVVCGCCKRNLIYIRGFNPYFTCRYRYTNNLEACVFKVNAMFMEQYVLYMLQDKRNADGELEKLRREAVIRLDKEIKDLKVKRQLLSDRIIKLQRKKFEEYHNYASGKTDRFQPDELDIESIENQVTALDEAVRNMEISYNKLESDGDSLSAGDGAAVLSKDMIDHYIEKIVVYDEQKIEICWSL